MNLKTTLLAATLTAFAVSTSIAFADHHMAPKAEAAKEKQADTPKSVKKHSHVEEKSNMPMPEPASGVGKQDTMKMDMHDHTKDRH